MNHSYLLVEDEEQQAQGEHRNSFIGGVPRLPADMALPVCALCGAEQTFFFQVTFPEGHFWHDLTMSVFACTSCAQRGHFIPEMLQGHLRGIVIPEMFLEEYQRNFRVLVFESRHGVLRRDYVQKVKFRGWKLVQVPDSNVFGPKIGGQPTWLLDDESPGSYGPGIPMGFLMQIPEGFEFGTSPTAPPQVELDISWKFKLSEYPYYWLFLQNNLYFFGTCDRSNPHVYILTQI